jgi:hypothetical protein
MAQGYSFMRLKNNASRIGVLRSVKGIDGGLER